MDEQILRVDQNIENIQKTILFTMSTYKRYLISSDELKENRNYNSL